MKHLKSESIIPKHGGLRDARGNAQVPPTAAFCEVKVSEGVVFGISCHSGLHRTRNMCTVPACSVAGVGVQLVTFEGSAPILDGSCDVVINSILLVSVPKTRYLESFFISFL